MSVQTVRNVSLGGKAALGQTSRLENAAHGSASVARPPTLNIKAVVVGFKRVPSRTDVQHMEIQPSVDVQSADERQHGATSFLRAVEESTSGSRVHGGNQFLSHLAERYSTHEWGQSTSIPAARMGEGSGTTLGFFTNFSDVYELGQKIGAGAFGTVYKATCRGSGAEVAVKCMSLPRMKSEKEKVKREVALLRQLAGSGCPNTADFLGAYEDVTRVYIVTELLGSPLETAPPQGTKRGDEAWEKHVTHIMRNVLRFLGVCHAKGIVYRDVKPANFLADSMGGTIKGIDLGVSRSLDMDETCDEVLGTPLYMAPEMLSKEPNYGRKVDLWALGVMAFELLAGTHPLGHNVSKLTKDQLFARTRSAASVDLGLLRGCSDEARDFLSRLLTPDPEHRLSVWEALQHPWLSKDDSFHGTDWKEAGEFLSRLWAGERAEELCSVAMPLN